MKITTVLTRVANEMRDSGLNILPADRNQKRPVVDWRRYQKERYNGEYNTDALCVVCGSISNNVEVIDFDFGAIDYDRWTERVKETSTIAYETLKLCYVETTQSGGKHVVYRIETAPVDNGNRKLTAKLVDGDALNGKHIQADRNGNHIACTIETRGEGGICLIAPSQGYEAINGSMTSLPVVSLETRAVFFRAAEDLSDVPPVEYRPKKQVVYRDYKTPEGDYNVANYLRDDETVQKLLTELGFTFSYEDSQKEYWRRAGTMRRASASIDKDTNAVYCFSSNCAPIEPNRMYTPLQLLACVQYDDNLSECAKDVYRRMCEDEDQLYNLPFAIDGDKEFAPVINVEALDAITQAGPTEISDPSEIEFPLEICDAQGFIKDFVEFAGRLSPKRQPRLNAVCALTTLSFLIGRKVACEHGGSPCIYGVGISEPSTGKNAALQAAKRLLVEDLRDNKVHDSFESVQGLQNVIRSQGKAYLLQDEFGGYLACVNLARNNDNKSRLINEMLTLFSSYGEGVYYSGKTTAQDGRSEQPRQLTESPSLAIYGVTNPSDFSDAISGRFLKNGFAARLTYVYGVPAAPIERGYNARSKPSESLINAVAEWREFDAYEGKRPTLNVQAVVLQPVTADCAKTLSDLEDYQQELDSKRLTRKDCEDDERRDAANAFIGRLGEKLERYVTVFCCSRVGANKDALQYNAQDLAYAKALIDYELRLFRYLLDNRIASSEYERLVNRSIEWIRAFPLDYFSKRDFTQRFSRIEKVKRDDLLGTLEEREIVFKVKLATGQGKRAKTMFGITGRAPEPDTDGDKLDTPSTHSVNWTQSFTMREVTV